MFTETNSEVEKEVILYCIEPNCQAKIDQGQKFCETCGTSQEIKCCVNKEC